MPWCDTCDRFLSPSTVHTDGTCPTCGRTVDPGKAHAPTEQQAHTPTEQQAHAPVEPTADTPTPAERAAPEPVVNVYGEPVDVDDDEKLPLPWHLKLLAGALAVYLGYRFLQGIEWVFGK